MVFNGNRAIHGDDCLPDGSWKVWINLWSGWVVCLCLDMNFANFMFYFSIYFQSFPMNWGPHLLCWRSRLPHAHSHDKIDFYQFPLAANPIWCFGVFNLKKKIINEFFSNLCFSIYRFRHFIIFTWSCKVWIKRLRLHVHIQNKKLKNCLKDSCKCFIQSQTARQVGHRATACGLVLWKRNNNGPLDGIVLSWLGP